MSTATLFSPLRQRTLALRNRIIVSPMCQYSGRDGLAQDWHLVHYGAFAAGGAGVVMQEATSVLPEGRISPGDLGIWTDEQARSFAPITRFVDSQGAIPAIQLAHAGRKACTGAPWEGGGPVSREAGGWDVVGPSATPWNEGYPVPAALDESAIERVIEAFRVGARRALAAGFKVAEIHGAHGYLAHQFLSPLVNTRTDRWGGSFENRTRFVLEVTRAVRGEWPEELPVWVRLSATDWADGGWDVEQTVRLSAQLRELGVDLIDVSSGGVVPWQKIALGPGYQVPFAERVKREAGIATGAVGLITQPEQAEAIVRDGQADVVLLARELLRDPHWPLRAAKALGADVAWPKQYARAK